MQENLHTEFELRKHLHRLAKFGANIADAHSCFIFLPSWILSQTNPNVAGGDMLALGGYHSLSQSVIENSRLPTSSGLIGWVVRNERTIHVSPFERDSRTLGIYEDVHELKSFIGIPVRLEVPEFSSQTTKTSEIGAVICDSKKSFAFSKLDGKLLENLAEEVSTIVSLLFSAKRPHEDKWQNFIVGANQLIDTLGAQAIELLRISCLNFREMEQALGSRIVYEQYTQVQKLVTQALPEHFPSCQMPNGDLLIALDRMMAGFYTNRIEALCTHVAASLPKNIKIQELDDRSLPEGRNENQLQFACFRKSFPRRAYRVPSVERLVEELAGDIASAEFAEDNTYGYRRA